MEDTCVSLGLPVLKNIQFSSLHIKMVSMRSENPICEPQSPSDVFPTLAFNTVHLIDDGPFSSFQRISLSVSAFHAAPLLAIVGVMLSALSPQVVFQAPKHQVFRDACHLL